MRERPLRAYAHEVRAILEGRQTQLRRVVKPQPIVSDVCGVPMWTFARERAQSRLIWPNAREQVLALCPYGAPGDRLWVKETHYVEPHPSKYGVTREMIPHTWDQAVAATGTVHYRADPGSEFAIDGRRWTPSIHMRREHSRITLEVTGVRVERLQDISDADAVAEGVEAYNGDTSAVARHLVNGSMHCDRFARLWDSINGPGSWGANPWVRVVEFRRVKS